MSTHPNAMLLCILTPHDLARKTFREISEHENAEISEGSFSFKIGGQHYSAHVMESDYDESMQISAEEGQIVVSNFLTYGYGEKITWQRAAMVAEELEHWAIQAGKRHACAYEIHLSANYW